MLSTGTTLYRVVNDTEKSQISLSPTYWTCLELLGSLIDLKAFVCVWFADTGQLMDRDRTGRYGEIFMLVRLM